jgi:hypothetical protein
VTRARALRTFEIHVALVVDSGKDKARFHWHFLPPRGRQWVPTLRA